MLSERQKVEILVAGWLFMFVFLAVLLRPLHVVTMPPPDLGGQVDAGDLAAEADLLWDGKCLGRSGDEGRSRWWKGPDWDPDDHEVFPGETRYECTRHDGGWWFERKGDK